MTVSIINTNTNTTAGDDDGGDGMTDLEPLRQRAVVGTVRLEPLIHRDVVAQLVLGVGPAAGAAGADACKTNGPPELQ